MRPPVKKFWLPWTFEPNLRFYSKLLAPRKIQEIFEIQLFCFESGLKYFNFTIFQKIIAEKVDAYKAKWNRYNLS